MNDRLWRDADPPKVARFTAVESYGTAAFCTGERGMVLERVGPRDWRARCLNGPEADRRDLLALSLTDCGRRLWFCGARGALGYYDRMDDRVHSLTAPYGLTSRFGCLAVGGTRGEESVHVADDCGRVLRLQSHSDRCSPRSVAVPGDDSAFTGVVDAGGTVVAADAAGRLHYSENGTDWQHRRLSRVALRSIDWSRSHGLVVVDDAGVVYRNAAPNREGRLARATAGVGSPRAVTAAADRITVGGGNELLTIDGERGVREDPRTDETLYGVDLLENGTLLAVGTAGTIVEGAA